MIRYKEFIGHSDCVDSAREIALEKFNVSSISSSAIVAFREGDILPKFEACATVILSVYYDDSPIFKN